MNKKTFFSLIFVVFCLTIGISQSALSVRYLTAANDQYIVRNNSKAFIYINYVLEQFGDDIIPENVIVLAEAIYYDYLAELTSSKDMSSFREFQTRLIEFPYLATERLTAFLTSVTPIFVDLAINEGLIAKNEMTEKAAYAMAQSIVESNNELFRRTQSLSEEQLVYSKELQTTKTELQLQQEEFLEAMISHKDDYSEKSPEETDILIVILLCAIGVLAIAIIAVVIVTVKLSRKQQKLFTETLEVVSELKRNPLEPVGIFFIRKSSYTYYRIFYT